MLAGALCSPILQALLASHVQVSESRPRPAELQAAHAWKCQHTVPWLCEEPPRRDNRGKEEGKRERKGWGGAGGWEGGRIDSLSSTGTTELSCHGERGAAGRA